MSFGPLEIGMILLSVFLFVAMCVGVVTIVRFFVTAISRRFRR